MSEPNAPTDQEQPKPPPINVRASPKKELTEQTLRVALLAGFGVLLGFVIKSDAVLNVVLPATTLVSDQLAGLAIGIIGLIGTYAAGVAKFLKDHRQRKEMAEQLPDDKARLV